MSGKSANPLAGAPKQNNPVRALALFLTLCICNACWAGEVTWVDVRSAPEFQELHVPGALNIPYDQISQHVSDLGEDKDRLIYLYCGSGRRAGLAKETLDSLGFTHVVNIGGLEAALQKAGAPELPPVSTPVSPTVSEEQ